MILAVEVFSVAIGGELGEVVAVFAVQDGVDGSLAADVLDLSSAEIVGGSKDVGVRIREGGYHRFPEVQTHVGIGLLEADFIEEMMDEGVDDLCL